MSAISLKSITGITSITTPAGVDDQLTLHTNNTTERVKIDVAGNVHINNQLAVSGVTTHNEDVWFKGATSGRDVYWDKSANELRFNDNAIIYLGNSKDAFLSHDGSATRLQDQYGHFFIGGNLIQIKSGNLSEEYARMDNTSKEVKLYHNSIEKFTTKSTGIVVHGTTTTTGLGVTSLAVAGVSTFSGAINLPDDGTVHFGVADTAYVRGKDSTDGYLKLGTAGSERLRITSDGFVGINEDNPKTGLTIAKLGDYSTDDGNTYYMPVGKWSSVWNEINVIDNSTDYWVGFVGGYLKTSSSVNISLAPNRSNTSQQAGMYISGEATGNSSADFTVGKIIGGSATGSGTSGNVRATKSELLRITSDGKLLVGVTSGSNHHISSGSDPLNTVFQANLGGAGACCSIRVKMNTSANDGLQIRQNGSSSTIAGGAHATSIFNRENGPLRLGTNNSERLHITSGGSVNIGGQYTQTIHTLSANSSNGSCVIIGNTSGTGSGSHDAQIVASHGSDFDNLKLTGHAVKVFTNHPSGLTETMGIDRNGYVTKPKHPSFYVRRSTGGDGRSAGTPITEWSSTYANGAHNTGGHFNTSTGIFTAPVSGVYHFSAAGGYKQTGINFNQKFRLNNTNISEGCRFISETSHSTATISATIYMSAGNTLSLVLEYTHHVNTSFNFFSGHLVG